MKLLSSLLLMLSLWSQLLGAREIADLDAYYAQIDLILGSVSQELEKLSQELALLSSTSCDCCCPGPDDIILADLQQSIVTQQQQLSSLTNAFYQNNSQFLACCTNTSAALSALTQTVCYNNAQFLSCCTNTSNAILGLQQLIKNNSTATPCGQLCCWLAKAPLYDDVLMDKHCDLCPKEKIVIADDLTINGQGARISFACPDCPQFELNPGVTLTLKNVALVRITTNTFLFGTGSRIIIDKGVRFELADDIVFTNEQFIVNGNSASPTTFTIKAFGCPKNITVLPLLLSNKNLYQTINLGTNSLVLENIYFIGIESISIDQEIIGETIYTGSIVLSGFASVLIKQNTRAVFEVEGLSNHIRFAENNITLSGYLLFSDYFDSEVSIQSRLYDPIPTRPTLLLADNFLYLNSAQGRASLIFDDFWIRLIHQGANSFVTNNNAFLAGKTLEIIDYPIRQLSNDLTLDAGLSLKTALENAIEFEFLKYPHRSLPSHSRLLRQHITTAFDQKRRNIFSEAQQTLLKERNKQRIITAHSFDRQVHSKKRKLYNTISLLPAKNHAPRKNKNKRFLLSSFARSKNRYVLKNKKQRCLSSTDTHLLSTRKQASLHPGRA